MARKISKEKLVELLNQDLAGELQAIMEYLLYHYTVKGLIRGPIAELFESFSRDEMKHAEELSERIVGIGGLPTIHPKPFRPGHTAVEMLETALEREKEALRDYAERRDQCEESGEVGTALIIENIIVDEQHHHDRILQFLREEK
ncbi:MAG: ferritin-like domain-containing protein [Chloroflexi bacterium]|nr:ferritin-like domain-containing protein [Chloroflexota bacterium]